MKSIIIVLVILFSNIVSSNENIANSSQKHLAYIVSDIEIPFWKIMSRGIESKANTLGYEVSIFSANNLKKNELQNIVTAINKKVDGIIISPISSSTATTLLKLASNANIPVVISDIGADSGKYISYISSNNSEGAYNIGKILTRKMKELRWENGTVGIIAIPQKRDNGKARTAGFMKALAEAGIKSAGLLQQVDFSYQETYDYSKKLVQADPKLRAIWLQGSDKYQGALDAITDSHKKGEILLVCFDAEPEFIELIPNATLVGAAMQQPFLMGEEALKMMYYHLNKKRVEKNIQLPILAISADNIKANLPIIKRNVLGLEDK